MPSNKTVAVVVYTGKNTINVMLLFLSVKKKKRE
jgi:hypothetical protein